MRWASLQRSDVSTSARPAQGVHGPRPPCRPHLLLAPSSVLGLASGGWAQPSPASLVESHGRVTRVEFAIQPPVAIIPASGLNQAKSQWQGGRVKYLQVAAGKAAKVHGGCRHPGDFLAWCGRECDFESSNLHAGPQGHAHARSPSAFVYEVLALIGSRSEGEVVE